MLHKLLSKHKSEREKDNSLYDIRWWKKASSWGNKTKINIILVFIVWIVFTPLEQKPNLNHMEKYAKIMVFVML